MVLYHTKMYKLLWKENDALVAETVYQSNIPITRGDILKVLEVTFIKHGGINYIVSNDPTVSINHFHFKIFWMTTPGADDCLSARVVSWESTGWFTFKETVIGAMVVESVNAPTFLQNTSTLGNTTHDEIMLAQLEALRKKMEIVCKLTRKTYRECKARKEQAADAGEGPD